MDENFLKAMADMNVDGTAPDFNNGIFPMMQGMMMNLLSKDVLYPALDELRTKVQYSTLLLMHVVMYICYCSNIVFYIILHLYYACYRVNMFTCALHILIRYLAPSLKHFSGRLNLYI